MVDYSNEPYFQPAEELKNFLCERTQSTSESFFRTLVDYNLCKLASVMRVKIDTHDRGTIPVNMYAIALAPSGTGKGHSTNIMEEQVLKGFRTRYVEEVLPEITEIHLAKLANHRAKKKGTDADDEMLLVKAEFDRLGTFVFNFDSATTPAVKQMRHKLLMCNAGAVNMEIDEIGSNLLSQQEVLTAFLELFDVGKIKQKLTKNTNENVRGEEIEGKTPTNLLLFGTPSKLLSGGKTEEEFMSMLETGYARRCFFAYTSTTNKRKDMTPEEAYQAATNKVSASSMHTLATQLERLADPVHFDVNLTMSKDVAIEFIQYRMNCEKLAEDLSEHEEIEKAEVSHRYFKAIKLAGAYAFADGLYEIKMPHAKAAIKRAEESGKDFAKVLTRDRNYVKLAKYLINIGQEVTNVELHEDLAFYRGSAGQKNDLISLAIAWAYRHHSVIKRKFVEGIEFFKGETLEVTKMDEMRFSYSGDIAVGYKPSVQPFSKLGKLFLKPNLHWCSHYFINNHRTEENAQVGFNMVVLDVDGGTTIQEAQTYLADFNYHMYTTKRHTDQEHRFRIVLPLSHTLKMDREEYRQFMENIAAWLPISLDDKTFQRSRKWMTHNGELFTNSDGKNLDALLFIPKTSKSEKLKSALSDLSNLSNVERWFVHRTGDGNRNQQLLKYALMLVDANKTYEEVERAVNDLNSKLPNSLNANEIASTILTTTAKAVIKRDKG